MAHPLNFPGEPDMEMLQAPVGLGYRVTMDYFHIVIPK
jgi:hypothetical protein